MPDTEFYGWGRPPDASPPPPPTPPITPERMRALSATGGMAERLWNICPDQEITANLIGWLAMRLEPEWRAEVILWLNDTVGPRKGRTDMPETTTQARRRPSQAEITELRSNIGDLTDHLKEAAESVHQAFLLYETVSRQFQWLLENCDVADALQGLTEGDVVPQLQGPDPDKSALQVLRDCLEQIGADLVVGYRYGDETQCAADALLTTLDRVPAEEANV
jgi:hypothetical protein